MTTFQTTRGGGTVELTSAQTKELYELLSTEKAARGDSIIFYGRDEAIRKAGGFILAEAGRRGYVSSQSAILGRETQIAFQLEKQGIKPIFSKGKVTGGEIAGQSFGIKELRKGVAVSVPTKVSPPSFLQQPQAFDISKIEPRARATDFISQGMELSKASTPTGAIFFKPGEAGLRKDEFGIMSPEKVTIVTGKEMLDIYFPKVDEKILTPTQRKVREVGRGVGEKIEIAGEKVSTFLTKPSYDIEKEKIRPIGLEHLTTSFVGGILTSPFTLAGFGVGLLTDPKEEIKEVVGGFADIPTQFKKDPYGTVGTLSGEFLGQSLIFKGFRGAKTKAKGDGFKIDIVEFEGIKKKFKKEDTKAQLESLTKAFEEQASIKELGKKQELFKEFKLRKLKHDVSGLIKEQDLRVLEVGGKKVVDLGTPTFPIKKMKGFEKVLGERIDVLKSERQLKVFDVGRIPKKPKPTKAELSLGFEELGKRFEKDFGVESKMFKLETMPKPKRVTKLERKLKTRGLKIAFEKGFEIKPINIKFEFLKHKFKESFVKEFEKRKLEKKDLRVLEVGGKKVVDLGTQKFGMDFKMKKLFDETKTPKLKIFVTPKIKDLGFETNFETLKIGRKQLLKLKTKKKREQLLTIQIPKVLELQKSITKELQLKKQKHSFLFKPLITGKSFAIADAHTFAYTDSYAFGKTTALKPLQAFRHGKKIASIPKPKFIQEKVAGKKLFLSSKYGVFQRPPIKKVVLEERERKKRKKPIKKKKKKGVLIRPSFTGIVLGIEEAPIISKTLGVVPGQIRGLETGFKVSKRKKKKTTFDLGLTKL